MRRIREYRLLEIASTNPTPDRYRKQIDNFLGFRAEHVRSEDAVSSFLDEHLETGMSFSDSARGIPSRSRFGVELEMQVLLSRFRFTQPYRSERRCRENYGGNPEVIRLLAVPVQEVRCGDGAFVTGYGSEG